MSRPSSFIYDRQVRSLVFQVLLILGLVFGAWWLGSNTLVNLAAQGKTLGFGFLTQTSGFQINATLGTWLMEYNVGSSTYLDVYVIGIINTFLVASLGIIGATILGFTMGIMRLSKNFVIRGFATIYVEVLRNIPLLLQLFFWYFAVLRSLPNRRGQIEIFEGAAGINITGLYLPAPLPKDGAGIVGIAFILFIIMAFWIGNWAKKRQSETGQRFRLSGQG